MPTLPIWSGRADQARPDEAARARADRPRRAAAEAGDVHVLPLVGQIAAGGPLLAEQNRRDYLSVPEPLASGGEEFLLRVRGDSMQDAGILEGDYVVVRRTQDARNGEIVVALAGDDESTDEATVKRFFREVRRSAFSRRTPPTSRSTPTTSRSSAV
jgi:repressor LexA